MAYGFLKKGGRAGVRRATFGFFKKRERAEAFEAACVCRCEKFARVCVCVVLGFLLICVCGCNNNTGGENTGKGVTSASDTQKVTFTDDKGTNFEIERPKSVVSLLGSFADVWVNAGGKDTLKGAAHDTWTNFDLDLDDSCIDIGGIKSPSTEAIIGCTPDLVLASCNTTDETSVGDTLAGAGLNVAYFDVSTLDDYLRMLKICCDLTGCADNYKKYGEDVRAAADKAIEVGKDSLAAGAPAPRVLSVRATGTAVHAKATKNNLVGGMLADMGCINVADSDNTLLDNLSIEAIIANDPDFIFVILHGTNVQEAQNMLDSTLLNNPAWKTLRAVKENHFFVLDNSLFNIKPNARWAESYQKLADILYGE